MRLKIFIFFGGLVVGYILYASYMQWQYIPDYEPNATRGNYAVADVSFCYKSHNEEERQIVSTVDLKTKTGYMRFKNVDIGLYFYDKSERLVFSSYLHPTDVDTRHVIHTSTFTLPEEPLFSDVQRYKLYVGCSYSRGGSEMWYTTGTVSNKNTNNGHDAKGMDRHVEENLPRL